MLSLGSILRGRLRRAPLVFLSVVAVAALHGQPRDLAGTLPEDHFPELKIILQTAIKQSPQVLLREIEVAQQEARIYAADALRWPSMGGDIRYGSNQTAISSRTDTQSRDNGLFYSVGVNQSLFHWGAIKHSRDIARIRVAIAERNYVEAYRTLVRDLRRGYVGLVARKSGLRFSRYSLGLREAELKIARERLASGTVSPGEVGMRQLNLDEDRLRLDRTEAEFAGERRRFGRLAGIGDIAEDAIPAEMAKPVYSPALATSLLAALLRAGGKSSFEVQVAELQLRQADLDYRIASVRLRPKFNAAAAYSLQNSTYATQNSVTQTGISQQTIEVNARWSIFDGFASRGAKLEALTEKRYWERRRQIASETVLDEAQQLERMIALDARAMDFSENRRAGAEEGVRRAQEEVKLGNAPQTHIDNATGDLRLNEYNNALARAAFFSNWSSFVSLAGDDPALNSLPARYVREKK